MDELTKVSHWAISLQQAQQMSSGNDGDTEYQMGSHLGVAAHLGVSTAMTALQMRIDALGSASNLEPLRLMRRKGNLLAASHVVIDQRHMPQVSGSIAQNRTAIGGIGQIVEINHLGTDCSHQRYHYLTIVHRRRDEDRLDRNVAIGCIDVQFIAAPTTVFEALTIAFGSRVAGRGQFRDHPGQSDCPCCRRRRESGLGGRTSPRRGRPRRRGILTTGGALAAGFSLTSIAVLSHHATWAHQLIPQMRLEQGVMTALSQSDFGELGKCPRKAMLARNPMALRETTQTPQQLICPKTVDQRLRQRQVQRRLVHDGTGQHHPIIGRAGCLAQSVRSPSSPVPSPHASTAASVPHLSLSRMKIILPAYETQNCVSRFLRVVSIVSFK